jgi:hypothetical protein
MTRGGTAEYRREKTIRKMIQKNTNKYNPFLSIVSKNQPMIPQHMLIDNAIRYHMTQI